MRNMKIRYGNGHGIESHDIRGKRVLTNDGKEIGKVAEIVVDRHLDISGVEIHRGLVKKDIFVPKKYVESLGKDGVILKITPPTEYEGMKVFDARGRQIGKVKKVRNAGGRNLNIVIDRGLLRDDLVVTKDSVQNIGENVILNTNVGK